MLPDSNSVQPTNPASKAKQYHQATCDASLVIPTTVNTSVGDSQKAPTIDYSVRPMHHLYSCNGAIAVLRCSESVQPDSVLPGQRGRKGSL